MFADRGRALGSLVSRVEVWTGDGPGLGKDPGPAAGDQCELTHNPVFLNTVLVWSGHFED